MQKATTASSGDKSKKILKNRHKEVNRNNNKKKETIKIDRPVYNHHSSEPNENKHGNRMHNFKNKTIN